MHIFKLPHQFDMSPETALHPSFIHKKFVLAVVSVSPSEAGENVSFTSFQLQITMFIKSWASPAFTTCLYLSIFSTVPIDMLMFENNIFNTDIQCFTVYARNCSHNQINSTKCIAMKLSTYPSIHIVKLSYAKLLPI